MSEDWQVTWHKQVGGSRTDIGQVYLGQSLQLVLEIVSKDDAGESCQAHVELQTGSQRSTLLDQSIKTPDPQMNQSPNRKQHSSCFELDWEVKEAGVHVLACSITGPRGTSRSFHKFTATSPFQLRTRSSQVNEGLLVAAQLTNITLSTFYIEDIYLIGEEKVGPGSGRDFEFRPRSSYQYLFRARPSEILGRLDIRWRTAEGDLGHLQTAPLAHSPSADKEPISLVCGPQKKQLLVNEPGEIQLTLTNNTQRPLLDVFLGFGKDQSMVLPMGESFVQVGVLEPGKTQAVTLPVIPLQSGPIDVDNLVLGFSDEWVKQRIPKTISLYVEG